MAESEDLRPEYRREDLGEGVRGKYHRDYKMGTNLVLLDPDVAEAFPDAKSVNDALRGLKDLAERTAASAKR
jgi:hypothetical protein